MEKVIEIDIKDKHDFYDRYSLNKVSSELVNYIIECATRYIKADKIIVAINNHTGIDIECKRLLEDGLHREYDKSLRRHQRNNIAQIFYLVVGMFTLFLATLLNEGIFKELVVIGGWVFIWELVEVELFSEMSGLKKRRVIKKLLKTPIIERK